MSDPARKAVIIGAGPVGCLSAIALSNMGWEVEIYEARPDMRLPSSKGAAQQRSINLAISPRGILALHAIQPDAADRCLRAAVPMRGRMIHDTTGKLSSQSYDRSGQSIKSIDRAVLNEDLLDVASKTSNVKLFFRHKVIAIDFDGRTMQLEDMESKSNLSVPFHFCVGADGSYSIVRRQLMRVTRMDYEQAYIPHEYLELKMPAGPPQAPGGEPTFLLDPNHLHIWPRHSFMLIALPNQDKTFTCTLFAPTAEFDKLTSSDGIIEWFKTHFPDALTLIGQDALLHDFKNNPRSSLISIKAKPYHYKDRVVILGDAAHSMVPFYGQGLNCGLEDVRVLYCLLQSNNVDPLFTPVEGAVDESLAKALDEYTETRHEDLITISDLAMDNYTEMRHSVTTPAYLFRKNLDNLLSSLFSPPTSPYANDKSGVPFPTTWPSGWLPLYTMVTFRPDISYATVKRKARRQGEILSYAGWATAIATLGAGAAVAYTFLGRLRR
ncbi:kynurenine 3-monooxygenase, mitochondrial precursor (Biosynthesis of nicotinic acid protein 4) [Steccherinum ochraceum]|uniref:Kynurenine 3-monooxygenase n=1 Tax=Steccherinum ochraceum TaxID=92696 RepID=A0A4R0R7N7_9APHY|nr:kynurenine 3-monooxygenase, mitochondrial precursor (Biosynthesis of nicotinic acid protein 4) [Steccherinum ochraceum]